MAFDGVACRAIANELNNKLINGRIEKIYVPSKNEVWLYFHTADRKNVKLLLSIDANNGRFHLSNDSRDNPEKAPQFCMVLRKYLSGAKLLSISQVGLDRIIFLNFETIDDFGDITTKSIVLELMGKYSNLILLDDEKIIDSMRHVDITMSSVREVLPGRKYILPTSLGKINIEDTSFEDFSSFISKKIISSEHSEILLSSLLPNCFVGFSKVFVSTVLSSLSIDDCITKECITNDLQKKIYDGIFNILNNGLENYASSEKVDAEYSLKEKVSLINNAKLNLIHEVNSNINKINKKLDLALETLKDAPNLELYKKYGEIISSNIYKMQIGMEFLETEDFYNNNEIIKIPLKSNFTPSRNAQNYFKKYSKLKNAILHANEHKAIYENEINYLNSVLFEIDEAMSLNDLDEIKEELINSEYIKKQSKYKKKKDEISIPFEYEYNGVKILAGRNNVQNDRLTLKIAKKNYTWLHTKDVHGSHVIIESDAISDELLYYAATIAKKHSKAKDSSKVEVDYTLVKFVHKESGAKPRNGCLYRL